MGDTLYEQDFHAWAMRQAELLRNRNFDRADFDNIAEEIESLGRREKHELVNRLAGLLTQLLKWRLQPGFRGGSWRLTVKEQRLLLIRLLRDSPSLKLLVKPAMVDAYGGARLRAERETGLTDETFPNTCPFTFDQVIDDDFFPDD